MFDNPFSKWIPSIGSWLVGFFAPVFCKAGVITEGTIDEAAREIITFYMQNLSFLVAIIAGLMAIYSYANKKEKDKKGGKRL